MGKKGHLPHHFRIRIPTGLSALRNSPKSFHHLQISIPMFTKSLHQGYFRVQTERPHVCNCIRHALEAQGIRKVERPHRTREIVQDNNTYGYHRGLSVQEDHALGIGAVSYTHLTLPTIYSV